MNDLIFIFHNLRRHAKNYDSKYRFLLNDDINVNLISRIRIRQQINKYFNLHIEFIILNKNLKYLNVIYNIRSLRRRC